ncbi:MAG TPA: helix-turn-helix domain-containing protein [Amycolatopsis sp.]|nr:helix-turn-helix domain-containing protein [Amycolatopsis sp.]
MDRRGNRVDEDVATLPALRGRWVRTLRIAAEDHVEPVCSAAAIRRAETAVGNEPVAWAVRLGYDIAVRNVEEYPEFGGGEAQLAILRLGTETAALAMLLSIDVGRSQSIGRSGELADAVRDYVHRRIPLEIVWESVRQGHAWLTDRFMQACVSVVPAEQQAAHLQAISSILFDWVGEFSKVLSLEYIEENERWLATTLAARDEAVRALRDGTVDDVDAASRVLRYALANRHHLGMVLWAADALRGEVLQEIAISWLRLAGAHQVLLLPRGRGTLHAWGNSTGPLRPPTAPSTPFPAGVAIAAGECLDGVAGFCRSHRQARETQRVATLSAETPDGVMRYQDYSLLTLLTHDPGAAVAFLHDELGDLARPGSANADLRATVRDYLDTRSPQVTAGRLYIARNTVTYRLKRAEEILHRGITDRPLELWTALVLAQIVLPAD